MEGSTIKTVYRSMMNRCFSLNCHSYKNYGGRGITVCDEWKDDFKEFEKWALSSGFSPFLEIDRINNNGNYKPSNCRFVTKAVNARNRRTSKLVEDDSLTIRQMYKDGVTQQRIAAKFGVSQAMISGIVNRTKWAFADDEFEELHRPA